MESATLRDISLIIGIWVSIYGIDSWRREYIGKRRIELAESVLAMFYEAKDVISYIRSPFGFEGEGSSRKKKESETPEEAKLLDQAYVVFERYDKTKDVFNKLKSVRYQFMALHGTSAIKPFDELNKIVNNIFFAARMLSTFWLRQGRVPMEEEQFEKHIKDMHKYEAIFWDEFDENDSINNKLSDVIKSIEEICRPIIESKRTLFGFLNKKIFIP